MAKLTTRTPRLLPTAAACVVLILGVPLVWDSGEKSYEQRCDFSGQPEASSVSSGPSLWPPGTECIYTRPDGSERVTHYVPWAEWLIVIVVAAGAGFATRLVLRRRRSVP